MTRPTTNAGKALAREHPELAEIVRAIEVEARLWAETQVDALAVHARSPEHHYSLEQCRAALNATPDKTPAVSVVPVPEVRSPDGTTAGVLSGAAPEPPFPYYADDDVRMGR